MIEVRIQKSERANGSHGSDPRASASDITTSSYIAEYDSKDSGKTTHYMVKSSGDKGPWSETVSATITA